MIWPGSALQVVFIVHVVTALFFFLFLLFLCRVVRVVCPPCPQASSREAGSCDVGGLWCSDMSDRSSVGFLLSQFFRKAGAKRGAAKPGAKMLRPQVFQVSSCGSFCIEGFVGTAWFIYASWRAFLAALVRAFLELWLARRG